MNVMHFLTSMDPVAGGVCQAVRSLIPVLEKFGITNEVVCLDDPSEDFFPVRGTHVNALGKAKGRWASHPKFRPWLKANFHRFDVVIIHGLWQYGSFAISATMRDMAGSKMSNGRPKVFVMPHGMLDPWFQRDPSRRLKAWRNWIYWKLIERNVVNGADGILFTCEQELLLARQTFAGYLPKRELNVGLGIAEPPPEATQMRTAFDDVCSQREERPYLLFISRIHPKKGVDLLLHAYAKLRQNVLGITIPIPDLVIAGPVDSAYAQEMIALAERLRLLGAAPVVHFVGMLQGDAKWGAFYGCDAFVLPSHQENFGIAVAEALACGKPVLISNQVNIWREIESSGAGFVADDNEQGTYQLLDRWCRLSETERQSMHSKARACYQDHFDVAVSTGRMADALRSVVDNVASL